MNTRIRDRFYASISRGELNINVHYSALTGQIGGKKRASEWRIFGLGYSDYRVQLVFHSRAKMPTSDSPN